MQYTAYKQDSAVHLFSRRSRVGVMGERMVGVMQYQISHAASIHSQLQLYDWHPYEFSDVPRLIRPTIYEQDFEWFFYDYS